MTLFGLLSNLGQILWVGQALGVPLVAETWLSETTNIGGQLENGSWGLRIDLDSIINKQPLDLLLEGVQLVSWLFEDMADHELSAVIGVKLESGLVEWGK